MTHTVEPPHEHASGEPKNETSDDLKRGAVINGRYEIVQELGVGGMAIVFLAKDKKLANQEIVLKFIKPENNDFAKAESWKNIETRFQNEMEISKSTNNANLVKSYEFIHFTGNYKGVHYEDLLGFSMEYVNGGTLDDIINMRSGGNDSEITLQDVNNIAIAMLNGLEALHSRNVIHRDIKPDNILIASSSEPYKKFDIKITDLGLAKDLAKKMGLTKQGDVYGHMGYMSPEAYNEAKAHPQRDIYAFGVILLELLSGRYRDARNYFKGARRTELKEVPEKYHYIVKRCLEPLTELRYESTGEVIQDLLAATSRSSRRTPELAAIEASYNRRRFSTHVVKKAKSVKPSHILAAAMCIFATALIAFPDIFGF